ncbi:thymidine phosphorylase [Chloroflexota bacterium]
MRAVDIIINKRDKKVLSRQEIDFFIKGYTSGEIPNYQASAWAMAILLNGMTAQETTDLTLAMANSGEILDLSEVVPLTIDKHSTGGVGDKTTLVVEPVVAACGLPVGKMSGRGLDFSGGTLDKMESIPGYRTDLTTKEFTEQLRTIGLVLTGQTADLAPADGKLYALRDVTGTVQSIPLIASSVMSKKIAAGAQAMLFDVKVGEGAFMKTQEDARTLAEMMVSIAKLADRKAIALLSDMNQPLGHAVGNALELREAIETLHGNGPGDFLEHCLLVAGYMLALGGISRDEKDGRQLASKAINNGRAWERFRELVVVQGGDVSYIDEPALLPSTALIETIQAPRYGYISGINAFEVGRTVVTLGGGRTKKDDPIDHAVGVIIHNKVGKWVEAGDPLFTIHTDDHGGMEDARMRLLDAHSWSDDPIEPLPLFYGVVE